MLFFPDVFTPYIEGREFAIDKNWQDYDRYQDSIWADMRNREAELNLGVREVKQPGALAQAKGWSDARLEFGSDWEREMARANTEIQKFAANQYEWGNKQGYWKYGLNPYGGGGGGGLTLEDLFRQMPSRIGTDPGEKRAKGPVVVSTSAAPSTPAAAAPVEGVVNGAFSAPDPAVRRSNAQQLLETGRYLETDPDRLARRLLENDKSVLAKTPWDTSLLKQWDPNSFDTPGFPAQRVPGTYYKSITDIINNEPPDFVALTNSGHFSPLEMARLFDDYRGTVFDPKFSGGFIYNAIQRNGQAGYNMVLNRSGMTRAQFDASRRRAQPVTPPVGTTAFSEPGLPSAIESYPGPFLGPYLPPGAEPVHPKSTLVSPERLPTPTKSTIPTTQAPTGPQIKVDPDGTITINAGPAPGQTTALPPVPPQVPNTLPSAPQSPNAAGLILSAEDAHLESLGRGTPAMASTVSLTIDRMARKIASRDGTSPYGMREYGTALIQVMRYLSQDLKNAAEPARPTTPVTPLGPAISPRQLTLTPLSPVMASMATRLPV